MGDGKTLHDVRQRLHFRYITGVIAACLLAACGPRDDVYNPSHFQIHAPVAPRNVAVPSNWKGTSFDFNGLYVEPPNALACCWIASQATLLVRKVKPARSLVAGFWVPNVPFFADGQRVRVTLPGQRSSQWFELDANGPSSITVALPAKLQRATGLIPVQITSAKAYVPMDNVAPPSFTDRLLALLGVRTPRNDDDRKLGVILRYAFFEPDGVVADTPAALASPSPGPPFFPLGVAAPANWRQQQRDGVWSAPTRASCCFLAGRANVHLQNPSGTQLVVFKLFVPSYVPLLRRDLTASCAFDGIAAGPPVTLHLGTQDVTFRVPPSLRDTADITATLSVSKTWIPARLGLGGDRRELSVVLTRAGYI